MSVGIDEKDKTNELIVETILDNTAKESEKGTDSKKTNNLSGDIESIETQNKNGSSNDISFSSVQEVIKALSQTASTVKKSNNQASKQTEKSAKEKISEANEKAKEAILKSYISEEKLRQKRQQPITIAVIILLSLQLIFFNVLMFALVFDSAKTINVEMFDKLLEFLKYYICAVVVELIGLLVTITTNTFSSQLSKNIAKIFFNNK